ncbi:hypothetical protein EK21DRAFT_91635 [Setomelanomma holmii]|uniref:PARP-type domain-containing protein n=1 Tax=Setomelanomma holmii TaxID=210430 RepID=A0A9P4H4D3_9PLEO|nr:hypothetical protein EK21DRAFT_91635 [Setomelanomma holmii]
MRWYLAWRHWGGATKYQIKGMKEVADSDPTQAPGYDRLSTEAQEQVTLAFENEVIVDNEFKGTRTDLAETARRCGGEIENATGYKVDIAKRTSGCRNAGCSSEGGRIAKGELRLGICVPFDEDHASWVYKHWKCVSDFDLLTAHQLHHLDGCIDGILDLPGEDQKVVEESLDTSERVQAPEPQSTVKAATKPEAAMKVKPKKDTTDDEEAKPKPKRTDNGKGKGKRISNEMSVTDEASEPEYVPKRTRSRAVKMQEVVDPAVARIEAMAENLRWAAAR